MRTPEQTARLERLAEVMQTIADPDFDGLVGLDDVECTNDCGTYRCVLGWYLHVAGVDLCFGLGHERAHFGITEEQSYALFGAFGGFIEPEEQYAVCDPFNAEYDPEATRREVTERRRYLVTEILGKEE